MLAPGPCRRSGRRPDATGECPDASGRCRPRLKGRSQLTQPVRPRSHRVVGDASGRRGRDRHAWGTLDRSPAGWSTPRGCSGQLWIIVTGVGHGRWMGRLPGFPEHMIAMVSANNKIAGHAGLRESEARGAGRFGCACRRRVAIRRSYSRSNAAVEAVDYPRRTPEAGLRGGRRGGSRPLARAQCSTLRRLA